MALLLNNAPVTITPGVSAVGPLSIPAGTRSFLVTYSCGAWPAVADGNLNVTIVINGVDVWSDNFQHVQLKRGGVVQSAASFGIGLSEPFVAGASFSVRFNNAAPSISTTVTVNAA